MVSERRYSSLPERIEFGETVWCPNCNGGKRSPKDESKVCARCNGIGVIPNRGPIKSPRKA